MYFGNATNALAALLGGAGLGLQNPLFGGAGLGLGLQNPLFGGTTGTLGLGTSTSFGGLQCFTGRINILVFIRPSTIIATLTTFSGQTLLLTTDRFGVERDLRLLDNRFATVCGNFVIREGQVVLNVQVVLPVQGAPQQPDLQQLLLLLLLLLFVRGQLSTSLLGGSLGNVFTQFGGVTGLQQALTQVGGVEGVSRIVSELGGEAAIQSQLEEAGFVL